MPMTTTWTEEKTWPVLLYRRESDGWKKQEFASSSSSSSSSSPLSSSLPSTRNNRYHPRITTVAPRKECIVFPALRQRFSLKSQTDQGTVIRRDDKILLISKRRARALLLQFQSLEDCLAFSDRFIGFNPKHPSVASPRNEDPITDESRDGSQQEGEAKLPIVREEEHKEVVSWVTRLLHDEDFLSYVHKIENYIADTEDGVQILEGLEHRELSLI